MCTSRRGLGTDIEELPKVEAIKLKLGFAKKTRSSLLVDGEDSLGAAPLAGCMSGWLTGVRRMYMGLVHLMGRLHIDDMIFSGLLKVHGKHVYHVASINARQRSSCIERQCRHIALQYGNAATALQQT